MNQVHPVAIPATITESAKDKTSVGPEVKALCAVMLRGPVIDTLSPTRNDPMFYTSTDRVVLFADDWKILKEGMLSMVALTVMPDEFPSSDVGAPTETHPQKSEDSRSVITFEEVEWALRTSSEYWESEDESIDTIDQLCASMKHVLTLIAKLDDSVNYRREVEK